MKKIILTFLLLFSFITNKTFAQQDEMFKHKKERKRVWRKWRRDKGSYNPYLDTKAKKKPSARMARGDKKELKRQKRNAKRQLRRNKKALND